MDGHCGLEKLRGIIENAEDRLTKTDRLLIQEILANPTEAAVLSASDLAGRAGVHPSNVIRLARKLGFPGFPQMRTLLRDDLFRLSDVATRVRDRVSQSAAGSFLEEVVNREINALGELPHHIPQSQLDHVAAAIARSGHVLLFGQGHAVSLMHLLSCRLRRSGYRNTLLTQCGVDFAEQAALLRPKDVVVAFSFYAMPAGLEPLLEQARKVGAVTVLISDIVGLTIRPKPDFLLAAYRHRGGESLSLTVSMAICNALILSISKLDDGRSLAALARYSELCELYVNKSYAKHS